MDTYGNVIYGYNAEEEMPMASITKIMTAVVALDSGIDLDEPIAFIEEDWPEGAQLAGYKNGDTPTFGELIRVALVYSGNDCADNIAFAVGGSIEGFADLMNAKAYDLNLTHTHFKNPHGLEEEGHYSCAADLCVLARYAYENYPYLRECVRTPSVTIVADGKEITLRTTDALLGTYDGLMGMKTGNTESGSSFLGAARRNHVTLYSCALCCDTRNGRFETTESLLDWAFGLYEEKVLAHDEWVIRTASWSHGFWLRVPVHASHDVYGRVFPEGDVTYKTVMLKPGTLMGAHAPYGSSIWEQEGRHVGSVTYRTGWVTTDSLAWNPIELPLFADVEELAAS